MVESAQQAQQLVAAFDHAIVVQSDYDLAMTYAHPDLTVREPFRDPYVGRTGLDELMGDVSRTWDFLEPLTMTFHGISPDLVVGRFEAPVRLKPTGHEMDLVVTEWVTLRDGKVQDVEVFYWDQAPVFDARAAHAAADSNGAAGV